MNEIFSYEARLLTSPMKVYRELAAKLSEEKVSRAWLFVRRPLMWLFVVAAFVSFITAGRWVWFHIFGTALMWSFVPAYQILFVAWISRLLRSKRPMSQVVDMFFAGQTPWYLLFSIVSGICIFAPEVWPAFQWLLSSGVFAGLFLATIGWSLILTYAFFRSGLEMSRARSAVGCALFYLLFDGTVAAWYLATGQLYPLLFGVA
jgi:hypothetical protein